MLIETKQQTISLDKEENNFHSLSELETSHTNINNIALAKKDSETKRRT